jgi:hypothetical protein
MLCGYLIFLITGISSSCPKLGFKDPLVPFGGGGKVRIGGSLGLVISEASQTHSFHRKNWQRKNRIRKVLEILART